MSNDKYIQLPVRSAAILTNSYVAGTVLPDLHLQNQVMLLIDITFASLTSAELKIEFSPNNTDWYQEIVQVVSGGTSTDSVLEHTFEAGGSLRLPVPVKDRFMRVSVKGTGTLTASSMAVKAVTGWV